MSMIRLRVVLGRAAQIQIQDDFSGVSLRQLAVMELGIYDLIPDYRDRCPLCDGVRCTVRHGLYHRRVIDGDGAMLEAFPIPRFRCRKRGPSASASSTFSVLPAELVPRRRLSLPRMLWILEILLQAGRPVHQLLDTLAECSNDYSSPWFPEPSTLYRVMHLFADSCHRLNSMLPNSPPVFGSLRQRAGWTLRALTGPARAAPSWVLAFHTRYFPRLLFNSVACSSQDFP